MHAENHLILVIAVERELARLHNSAQFAAFDNTDMTLYNDSLSQTVPSDP